jgi:hypothetical protein
MSETNPRTNSPEVNLLTWWTFGHISLSLFAIVGAAELLFFIGSLFTVLSLPPGMVDTLPISPRIGFVLLFGQFAHVAGIICGILGVLRDQAASPAWIGTATNSVIPAILLLSSFGL